jgi:hypothetical protein
MGCSESAWLTEKLLGLTGTLRSLESQPRTVTPSLGGAADEVVRLALRGVRMAT